MKKNKAKKINTENLILNVIGSKNWGRVELSLANAGSFCGFFGNDDTLAVFASGSFDNYREEDGKKVIAGVEWIRHETNPKINQAEPEINVYKYIIYEQLGGYYLQKADNNQTLVSHWLGNLDEILKYYDKDFECYVQLRHLRMNDRLL